MTFCDAISMTFAIWIVWSIWFPRHFAQEMRHWWEALQEGWRRGRDDA